MKKEIVREQYTGERPLISSRGLILRDTVFRDGESPLKERRAQ